MELSGEAQRHQLAQRQRASAPVGLQPLGTSVHDHIVIGKQGYASLKVLGFIR
jgi:DNA repair protein RadC